MVSIVLPVYNGEKYIEQSIESVLGQSYQNIELIIVNDCSTDRTIEIVKKYALKDKRIKIIENFVNLKLPRTLNVGFAAASGEYYTWTSDDNIYEPKAIEKMVQALENQLKYDMVYANYTNIDIDGNVISSVALKQPENLLMGNTIGACFLYTRKIAEKVGEYDVNLFLSEDYDFWIRLFREGNILHIEDYLYFYRIHEASLTETKKSLVGKQTYRTMEKNFLFMYTKAKKEGKENLFMDQMLWYLGKENCSEVEQMLLAVKKGYVWHAKWNRVKEKIRVSFLYELIRKIKQKFE